MSGQLTEGALLEVVVRGESSSPIDLMDLREPKTDETGRLMVARELNEGREELEPGGGCGREREGLRALSLKSSASGGSRLVTSVGVWAFFFFRVLLVLVLVVVLALADWCLAGSSRGVGWMWVKEGIEAKMLLRLLGGLDMVTNRRDARAICDGEAWSYQQRDCEIVRVTKHRGDVEILLQIDVRVCESEGEGESVGIIQDVTPRLTL